MTKIWRINEMVSIFEIQRQPYSTPMKIKY